jgi:hypothetical protein
MIALPSSKTIYVFRSGESGLYAFTADPKGHILPSRIYPCVRWRLERRVILRPDRKSPMGEFARATLDAIAKHGFRLAHAAINAEPLALAAAHGDKGIAPREDARTPEQGLRARVDPAPFKKRQRTVKSGT